VHGNRRAGHAAWIKRAELRDKRRAAAKTHGEDGRWNSFYWRVSAAPCKADGKFAPRARAGLVKHQEFNFALC
jgi:hypothetical protein